MCYIVKYNFFMKQMKIVVNNGFRQLHKSLKKLKNIYIAYAMTDKSEDLLYFIILKLVTDSLQCNNQFRVSGTGTR